MGRQRSIDRDKVLDVAEEIVATQGAAGLTIDSVARAMGISKGGVQYCFGSKDAMIDAMFGNDSNLLIVFYVQIMPDDFVMQLHRF
ncbi:transcriptional repressor BetI [Serratia liquefaciens]|nr:transcriptional repressor BetI [Serratia liquefaciens]CAI2020797.1 transcriptional repressor BetI [Serratia liquefaciens]